MNNAQTPAPGTLLEIDEETYRAGMESGPTATWRMMRACHRHLTGGGSIVDLGSAAGIRWDPSGTGAYAAAGEAVRVLTRTPACEWAGDGIRVNAILRWRIPAPWSSGRGTNPMLPPSICARCRWGDSG
ncbi:SDR family oxidoreductase [Nocardia sp. NPDC004568]|uniref:SDR family oxidoreductase n=1 Tax=Nocardia sp. NPDC004568 TaxID=3154551 RepID=UPI0033B973BE